MPSGTPQNTPPTSDPEAARITTIDELKTEQARQAGVLDQLLAIVKGGRSEAGTVEQDAHTAAQGRVESRLDRSSEVQEQMRQAIRDVRAEEAHQEDHDRMRAPVPETAPAEVFVRGKARLQRALFGGDPK